MPVDFEAAEREAAAGAAREDARMAAGVERIHHPAIAAPTRKCYRVIRRFLFTGDGRVHTEDIFNAPFQAPCWDVLRAEQGYAVLIDPNNKIIGWNGQSIEDRD